MKIKWTTKWNPARAESIIEQTKQSLITVGFLLQKDIKENFTNPGSYRAYPRGGGKVHWSSRPGEPPAVDYGRLRASISTNWTGSGLTNGRVDKGAKPEDGIGPPEGGSLFTIKVGTRVEYACLDAKTSIITDKGNKWISQIEVGNKVLTQTGDYHEVLQVFKRKNIEVPKMVTIRFDWRNGKKSHELTCTQEHKLLVFREGRNKWVEAGDLRETDLLFSQKKIPHNKGISIHGIRYCLNCSKQIPDIRSYCRKPKFCSIVCRAEYWVRTQTNPRLGVKWNEERRQRQSVRIRNRLETNPETHPNRVMSQRGYITTAEKQVLEMLVSKRLTDLYYTQYKIGNHFVDYFIPVTNEAYEADGAYWHQDQEKDIKRDKKLLQVIPDLKITHIHFYHKKYSPKNPILEPLSNVKYVFCNPDINSYVNLDLFETKKILSIKKWTLTIPQGKAGSSAKCKCVYDLSVDKVHSYYANGCLVSNSALEYGAPRTNLAPRPYMRPAVERLRSRFGEYVRIAIVSPIRKPY